ncbi:MAG TPA: hypothetical protein VFN30_04645 [Chitinophagaceae bacterium]|nr:hypothetical protein [Chitinophagaceae bacterium]
MTLKAKIIIASVLTILGAVIGYIYYRQVGCVNGCAIWSHPWRSTGYGALLGFLLAWAFVPDKKKSS